MKVYVIENELKQLDVLLADAKAKNEYYEMILSQLSQEQEQDQDYKYKFKIEGGYQCDRKPKP